MRFAPRTSLRRCLTRQPISADSDVTVLPARLSRQLELRLGDRGARGSTGGDQRDGHRHGRGLGELFRRGKFGIQRRSAGEGARRARDTGANRY